MELERRRCLDELRADGCGKLDTAPRCELREDLFPRIKTMDEDERDLGLERDASRIDELLDRAIASATILEVDRFIELAESVLLREQEGAGADRANIDQRSPGNQASEGVPKGVDHALTRHSSKRV
jgi:hypothetical protein